MMQKEYTKVNSERIRKEIYLHDVKITRMVWDYQDRAVSFDLRYWEWHKKGRLSFYGAVYIEGSALGLWCSSVENEIIIDILFADPECSVSKVFADCLQNGKVSPEQSSLPDPDNYFCVVFGTNTGDTLQFIVEKVVWETED